MATLYRLIRLNEAVAQCLSRGDGTPVVTTEPGLAAARLRVPPIAFGAVDPAAGGPIKQSNAPWAARGEVTVGPFPIYQIHDAVVHTRWGIVTSGPYLFTDTLYHVPLFLLPEAGRTPDGEMILPDLPRIGRYPEAVHLLTGHMKNYAHWLLDMIPRIEPELYGRKLPEPAAPGPLLLPGPWRDLQPAPLPEHQSSSFDLLLHPAAERRAMAPLEAVSVQRLRYVPNASGASFAPHPGILRAIDELRDAVLGGARPPATRKLYVSRQDASHRRMTNEDAIVAMMRDAGFEIILPAQHSLAAQIRLFDQASHVVGPQGAGNANILFSRPGTILCELHMDGFVQWAMRCLAALREVEYGCLIGRANEPWLKWPHQNSWTAPEDALARLVRDWA